MYNQIIADVHHPQHIFENLPNKRWLSLSMNLFRTLIIPYLHVCYAFDKFTKRGAFSPAQAVYTDPDHEKKSCNPLKNAMFKQHLKQFHDSSCSVASVVNSVNALGEITGCMANHGAITQMDILDKVKAANWKKRMSPEGDNGRRGLPLFMLGDVVKESLEAYNVPHRFVKTIQTVKDPKKATFLKRDLLDHLMNYDPKGRALIIAHFNQGVFVKALQIPHISPVGAFDPRTRTVTMLDVDFLQQAPYRISFDRFYEGLSNDYNPFFRHYGYGSGGYVYIGL
jgi:hypothetical protein